MVHVSPAYNKPAITETLYMRSFVARLSFECHADPSLQILEGLPGDASSPPYFGELRQEVSTRARVNKAVHCLNCLTFYCERIWARKEITVTGAWFLPS